MLYDRRILSLFGAVSIAAIMSLTTNIAIAATPDGLTPANEGVCDSLMVSGTKGLYGLCVAYCEAQDLDDIDKEPPSSKILANYRRKMQAGDPDMPCIQVSCPCFASDQLNAMTGDGIASCNRLITSKIRIDDDGILNFADVDTTANRERCRYVDAGASPIIVKSQRLVDDADSTAAQKAQACYSLIDTACSAIGQ
jgi:hypothetical protein